MLKLPLPWATAALVLLKCECLLSSGRHDPAIPRNQRMLSDKGSNVLVSSKQQDTYSTPILCLAMIAYRLHADTVHQEP